MDHAAGVGMGQRLGHLDRVAQRLGQAATGPSARPADARSRLRRTRTRCTTSRGLRPRSTRGRCSRGRAAPPIGPRSEIAAAASAPPPARAGAPSAPRFGPTGCRWREDAAHPAAADVFDQIEVPDPVARHHPAFEDSGSRVGGGRRRDRRRTGDDRRAVGQRLAGLARAADEPSARTGSVSPGDGGGSGFRALEAESFIRLLSRNRRRDSAAVQREPGPSLLHIHVVRTTRPLGRTPDKKSSSYPRNFILAAAERNVNSVVPSGHGAVFGAYGMRRRTAESAAIAALFARRLSHRGLLAVARVAT